jgi:hypothetical protein
MKEATMDSFAECRCLICYHEGDFEEFARQSKGADCELQCPECLNNDSDHIEKIQMRELVAV